MTLRFETNLPFEAVQTLFLLPEFTVDHHSKSQWAGITTQEGKALSTQVLQGSIQIVHCFLEVSSFSTYLFGMHVQV